MTPAPEDDAERAERLARSLSRWENEGGADAAPGAAVPNALLQPPLTTTELLHLRSRVIALENLVISLLATASDEQLDRVRQMAAFISPRPGYTQHPMTGHAAVEMTSLVDRSGRFRN